MKANVVLGEHLFNLTPGERSAEALFLKTRFISNGDSVSDKEGVFLNQELVLNSECNQASIELFGPSLTPEILRKLANDLEKFELRLRSSLMASQEKSVST